MAFQESVVITVDARQANRNLTTLEQRLSAVEQASRSVDSTVGSLNRSLQSGLSRAGADRQVDSLRASLDALRTSVDRSSQSLQQLGSSQSSRRIEQLTNRVSSLESQLSGVSNSANRAARNIGGLASQSGQANRELRQTRATIQNVAFQLQDVVVQAQAGTNELIILGQQGPQILGAFGAVGAIAGVLVGIGAAVASVLNPSINDTTTATENLNTALENSGQLFRQSSTNAVTLNDELRVLAQLSSDAATARLTSEILNLEGQLESASGRVTDLVTVLSPDQLIPLRIGIDELSESGRSLTESIDSRNASESIQLLQGTVQGLAAEFGTTTQAALRFVSAAVEADVSPTTESISALGIELQNLATSSRDATSISTETTTALADQANQVLDSAGLMSQLSDRISTLRERLSGLAATISGSGSEIIEFNSGIRTQIALQGLVNSAGEDASRQRRINNALLEAGATATQILNNNLSDELRETVRLTNALVDSEEAEQNAARSRSEAAAASRRAAAARAREEESTRRLNERAETAIANLSAETAATQAGVRELAIYRDTKSAIAAVEASSLPNKDRLIEQISEEAEAALDATDARREQAAEERRLDQLRTRAAREQEREAQRVERAYQRQFETINEGLADALLGYRSLRDVATSVAQDIARAFVRNQITGPLLQGLGLPGGTGQAAPGAQFSLGDLASSASSLFNNAGSSAQALFGTFARSSVGQAIGLSTAFNPVGASGALLRDAGVNAAAGLSNATLSGPGNFISQGLQFAPFAALGSLLAGPLGIQGSGRPLQDTVLSTAGGVAGGSIGSGIAALGNFGGPIGAALGAIAGTALSGLLGGQPSDRTQALSLETETGRFVSRGLQGNRFSQENRNVADQIGQSLGALNAFLQQQTGRTPGTELGVSVGDLRGLRLSQEGQEIFRSRNVEEFTNRAQEAVAELFDVNVQFYRDLANESETLGNAIVRINQQFTTVRSIADALGLSFAATGEAGQRAANQLVEAFGGQGQLAAAFQLFDQNFFTDEERRQRALEAAREQLNTFNNELGRSGEAAIDTRDEFRRYVQSLDLTTEAGSEAAATALRYQQAILAVDAATQQATNSEQERMTAINTARQEYIDAIREEGEVLSDTQRQFSDFARTLEATRRGLQTDSRLAALSPENQLALLRTQFEDVQRRAQLGDADAIAQLPQASRDFLGASREFYGQSEQYYRDFETVQQTLSNTQSVAERTASNAQMQLASLNAQLEALGEQSNLLRTIAENTAAQARQATQAAATRFGNAVAGGADGGSSASPTDLRQAVSALYTSGLGRAPDQAGLNFWVDQLRRGGNFNDVRRGFFAAAESNGEPIINRFQRGGSVRGPGTGTSDSIPAFVSNGEFVVRASSAQGNQGLLREINNDGGERLTAATEIGVEVNEQGFNDVIVELRAMRRELADMRRDNEALRANQR